MNRFAKVKQILDDAVGGGDVGFHGPFWRGTTRDQFVAKVVVGQQLLIVGDGSASNLVKALEGEAPFGLDTGTPGAIFRRMPAGRPEPAADADIDFIRQWIDDGCPADDDGGAEAALTVDANAGGPPADLKVHNDFWRDFDNRALFQAEPEVRDAITAYFSIARMWLAFAHDPAVEAGWQNAVVQPAAEAAIRLLANLHTDTVRTHYGNPVPLLTLLDGFERFGDDSLPDDPLRPNRPRHRMDGEIMWFFWCGLVDACLRLGINPEYWHAHARALLLGLMNDGLFRGRFTVNGFSADDAGKQALRQHVHDLDDDQLQAEMRTRFADTDLGT